MPIQSAKNRHHIPAIGDNSVTIADVPVKVAVMLGNTMLGELEHVVSLVFDDTSASGKSHSKDFHLFTAQGRIATEHALFTMAIGEFHEHGDAFIKNHAHTEILRRAAGHKVRLPLKRNGDIPYRMPMKA